jgi:repressor LexA
MPLTQRQREILDFITDYLQRHDYSPSFEEIAGHFGFASMNGVFKHLKVLEEKGFIRRLSNRARSIQLVRQEGPAERRVPLLGHIAAGRPIDVEEMPEEISVPEGLLTRGPNYVLRVEGDSMIDEHIQDGDLIIVEQRAEAGDGETVVALIDGREATLKKLYREDRRIRLQPANAALRPIYVEPERLRVQGVVVGLMRRY